MVFNQRPLPQHSNFLHGCCGLPLLPPADPRSGLLVLKMGIWKPGPFFHLCHSLTGTRAERKVVRKPVVLREPVVPTLVSPAAVPSSSPAVRV